MEMVKGYKGYNKDLTCKGKQYAENTLFEEEKAIMCNSGMHFCENPLDVLDFYGFVNKKGEINEFTEVQACGEVLRDDGMKKCCTNKLKVGVKLGIKGFIEACVDFLIEKTTYNGGQIDSGYAAQIGSSGDYAQIGSSGYAAKIGSSGYAAQIGSSGDAAQIGSSGDYAQIGSSGYAAQIGSSGYAAKIGSSGYAAQIGSSGDYAQIGSSGDAAQIGSSGDYAQIDSTGEQSVVMCAGIDSIAKAKKGSWITLAEWGYSEEHERYIPLCVKTEYVDDEIIKADTWYKLKNGEFTEV